MEQCTAAMASLTYAMKAQHALAKSDIGVKIVKLDPSKARRGCEYGIEYDCDLQRAVKDVLRNEGITARRFLKGGGEII